MRDRIAMALSALTRMGAGLLVFVLMARGLGPEAFGLVVTVMAYATLASLVTDFGFASKTLRDIAADRARGWDILNASLNVKIYFTVLVIVLGAVAVLLLPAPLETRIAMILLAAAVLIAAIGDLSLTAYRAVGRFASETWLTLWSSMVHLLVIGWIALAHGDVLMLAVAFLISRLVYALLALRGSMRMFPGTRFAVQPLRQVLTTARGAWSWAVDSGLNYVNAQLDGLVVAGYFGLFTAGIYQSGARFTQAGLNLVGILANIHIPRMARSQGSPASRRVLALKVLAEFSLAGLAIALAFWFGGSYITHIFLGPDYVAVDALWPGFGAFVLVRYIAAAAGAQLAALGMPWVRVGGQVVGLAVSVVGFIVSLPIYGYVAAPWVMTASGLSICIMYWGALIPRLALANPTRTLDQTISTTDAREVPNG